VPVSRDLWPRPWPWSHPGCGLHWGPSCTSLVAIQPFACEKKRFSWSHRYGKMEKFRKFRKFQNLIFQRIARIILQCLDLAEPVTQNFGPISSLTWRSRSRSPKSRSPTWRRMRVHSYEVSSKSDHKWRGYMNLKFRVFGTKMGLWPWKVGQGRWKWVSVLRSNRGPYLCRFRACPLNFFQRKKKQKRKRKKERKYTNTDKNNSLHHGNGEA